MAVSLFSCYIKYIFIMSNCNCEGKTINLSLGCCQPVLAPIENYYTKYQIDKMMSGVTSGCCITPEEVDEKIESAKTEIESEIPSLSGYATEQWVEDKHYLTEHQHLKTINNESLIGDGNIEIGTGGTVITIDEHLDSGSTNAVANSAITIAIDGKLDSSAYTPTDLSNYYTKDETNSAITQATSGLQKTLIAGNNITISGNTISANCCPTIWCGDYTEWSSVSGNPDTNTIYLIHQ